MFVIFECKLIICDVFVVLCVLLLLFVVFINGVFDILYCGYVMYFVDVKVFGVCLIVGVNSDVLVCMFGKGDDWLINCEEDCVVLLVVLESVDWVVMFVEKMLVLLIEVVCLDIFVKGGDYDMDVLLELVFVCGWGGCVLVILFEYDCLIIVLLKKVCV